MKILVVVSSIGRSAGGIVADELLYQLTRQNPETHIICNQNFSKKIPDEKVTELCLAPIHHNRKDKFFMMATNKEWNGRSWVKKGLQEFQKLKKEFNPDVVLSFISAYGFRVLELGFSISKNNSIPFAIHAVDPLPSTPAWGEHPILRKAIISIIKPYYKHASIISATNEAMLKYQLDVLNIRSKKNTGVIYNPAKTPDKILNDPSEPNSFLYLGTLYAKRNPQLIIDTFNDFLHEVKDSKFYFVGNNRCTNLNIPEALKQRVVFVDWTENPEAYIEKTRTLVDIDANIHGDVFMSSKISQYLMYNRTVLCITPQGSPVEVFTKNLNKTVFCARHTKEDILKGMHWANMSAFNQAIFAERNEIRKEFEAEYICQQLINNVSSIF